MGAFSVSYIFFPLMEIALPMVSYFSESNRNVGGC